MDKENINCLVDMKCPKCGNLGPFVIAGEIFALVSDDGVDETWDFDWSPSSYCRCRACDHAGQVGDFIAPDLFQEDLCQDIG